MTIKRTLTTIVSAVLIAGAITGCTKGKYVPGNKDSVKLAPTSPIWSSPAPGIKRRIFSETRLSNSKFKRIGI